MFLKGRNFLLGLWRLVSEAGKKMIEKRDGSLELFDFSSDKDEKHNLLGTLEKKTLEQFRTVLEFLKQDTGYDKAVKEAEQSYQAGGQMVDLAHY